MSNFELIITTYLLGWFLTGLAMRLKTPSEFDSIEAAAAGFWFLWTPFVVAWAIIDFAGDFVEILFYKR